jgi:hypothetical protein
MHALFTSFDDARAFVEHFDIPVETNRQHP